jgi:hypothetical protein
MKNFIKHIWQVVRVILAVILAFPVFLSDLVIAMTKDEPREHLNSVWDNLDPLLVGLTVWLSCIFWLMTCIGALRLLSS